MWVKSGSSVTFGNNLDPTKDHIKRNATTLRIVSNTDDWVVSHGISGGPTGVLALDYDKHLNPGNFSSDDFYQGGKIGGQDLEVSYKLHDLISIEQKDNYTLTVTFTVST